MFETTKQIRQIKEENQQLKRRCRAMTQGLMCPYCEMKCASRAADYNPDYIPEELEEDENE